ncbi:hypothetical protein MMC11_001196 [Xylographa trunciseda]|nr:hypothetical protein [Xylographa trunciseda]
MLTALRRGPTSLSRSLATLSTSFRPLLSSVPRQPPRALGKLSTQPYTRSFQSTSLWSRHATAAAEAEELLEEELLDEEELDVQDFAQKHDPRSHSSGGSRGAPVTKFQELADRKMVSARVVQTLTQDMKLETMTQVQSLTINETLKGIDVLAQARTGTGKTLAFLIPLLQNIIDNDPSLESRGSGRNRTTPTDIRAIIISPTRELAEQIAVEAQKVVRHTGVIVQTAVGGSAKQYGLRKIKSEGCHILVGTPGRLNDILSDPYSQVRAPNLSAFVLDEADRLLDQGFAPEIESIQKLLPDRKEVDRQTLLFSATVPEEVMHIVNRTMKPDYKFVRTVQAGEQQTHEKVPQKIVEVAGFENLMPAVIELCKRELAQKDRKMPFKAIIYFNATAEVALASAILQNLRNPSASRFDQHPFFPATIVEIHAKLSQDRRTRSADNFRRANSSILLSSDVTARGMDFPNVTHVIQVGLPSNRDTYIHRVGRTARGDKTGEGWLFITPLEKGEARSRLHKLPLQSDQSLETAMTDMTKDAQLPADVAQTLTQAVEATRSAPMAAKSAAYMATLGYFNWYRHKQELLDAMNQRSKYGWGLETPPMIDSRLAQKLNLSRLNGIVLGTRPRPDGGEDRRSFGSGRGGDRDSNSRGGRFSGGGDSTSGFGRGRDGSSGFGRDKDSTPGYGRDRGTSSGYGRDRESPTGYGQDRGGSFRERRSGNSDSDVPRVYQDRSSSGGRSYGGERSRTSRYS